MTNSTTEKNDNILLERRDHILIIRINRPEAKNSFDRATAQQMEAALDDYETDKSLRVAIITGCNGIFSAGADLKAVARGELGATEKRGGFGIMSKPPMKPLIAAVEGHALAGGFELAICCDLIVASETSQFGLPEVKRSLAAVGGACFRLPNRLPYHLAMEMILLGDSQPAQTLAQYGLVNRISKEGEALTEAIRLAEQLSSNGPLALQASKEIVARSQIEQWQEADAWTLQGEITEPLMTSKDLQEGLAAFIQKRQPVWRGE